MKETWKEVPGYNGLYEVSSNGRVRSYHAISWAKNNGPKIITQNIDSEGYKFVKLSNKGVKTKRVHRVMLETFYPERGKDKEVRHLDGVRTNNNLSNLCWGTRKENAKDKKDHGNQAAGESCNLSILTEVQVLEIRELLKTDMKQCDIAKLYGTTNNNLSRIKLRQTWQHI